MSVLGCTNEVLTSTCSHSVKVNFLRVYLSIWGQGGGGDNSNRVCFTIKILPGSKTASMGKFRTLATKTMENTTMSFEGKRCLENFLKEHVLNNSHDEFMFTSVTTLRTEGMFGVYN